MKNLLRPLPALIAASVLLGTPGCSNRARIITPNPGSGPSAYIITSDFSTGGLSLIDLATHAVTPNIAAVHSDATLRVFDGRIYVVNRFGQDNIQVIDPAKGYASVLQFSTGNGSNPQDIAFAGPGKAYVSRYGSTGVLVVDPRYGTTLGTISLAAFADGDGLPEMARMAIVAPYLFVACQRLENFVASNPSVVAVIDTRTDQVVDLDPLTPGVQGIALAGRNPSTDFVYDPAAKELLIGCTGTFGALDGGVERIDPAAFVSRGFAITEQALGGDIGDIAWNGAGHSYAIVSDASFNASLVAWSAAAHDTLRTVFAPGGFNLPDCEVDPLGELYVADNHLTAPAATR
jgi:hypothetical protein